MANTVKLMNTVWLRTSLSPKAKPQQYPETFASLREMMTDWVRARNYGIQTGDMQYVWPYMLDTYEKDIKFLKDIEGLYQRGG